MSDFGPSDRQVVSPLWSRRRFLATTGLAGAGVVLGSRALRGLAMPGQPDPWDEAAAIVRRIAAPQIPARDVAITRFGAKADGITDCTKAIADAIADAAKAGGGRVVIPAGRFLTGAVHLRSHVALHLESGSTLAFSRDPALYPIVFTRWEGTELMNYSPFIYALDQTDIAITGSGTLDGQADDKGWWSWKGASNTSGATGARNQNAARARLLQMGADGIPVANRVFGDGSYLRPNFVQPYRCRRVLIEGVTIVNSPMWEIHPVLCTDVIVRGVTINSHGPNNDGCDPESCDGVLIERCVFDTGDDCIAIKSGRNNDGRRVNVPSQNIVIRDCQMRDGHGGVVIGSEESGGVRNVFAERCRMDSPQLDRVLRLKTNSVRGGFIEHVFMRDVEVGEVAESIVTIDFTYEEGDTGPYPPNVHDINVTRVTSRKSKYALLLRGYPTAKIRDVRMTDCTLNGVAAGEVIEHVENVVLSNVVVNGVRRDETISR